MKRIGPPRFWQGMFPLLAVLVLSLLFLIPGKTAVPLLQAWGVPALPHPFMDLRGMAAWCDLFRAGGDPVTQPTVLLFPGEPPHPNFRMNYSPCIFLFSYLGLSGGSAPLWALGFILAYLLCLRALACPASSGTSLLWLALAFSPLSLLAMERGNLDLILFALLVAALLCRRHPVAGSAAILVASSFKFFPIVSLLAPFAERGRRGKIAAAVAAVIFVLFLVLLGSRLSFIAASLGGQAHTAFGSAVPADLLESFHAVGSERAATLRLSCKAVAWLLGTGCFLLGFVLSSRGDAPPVSERSRHAFLLGTPLFLLLFLSENQMDYKGIFLFFVLPAALELRTGGCRLLATVWMTLLTAYSYWTFFSDEGSLRNALLKQAVIWCLFALTALLAGRILSPRSQK